LYLSYFLYANGNGFPCFGSGYRFGGSLHGLFRWDDYLVLNGTSGYHPMAAIGRWFYGLGKCHGRVRSNHGKLHYSCTYKPYILPGSSH
jgi:hypothetical protein